jgi:large subunit ribosomal protein L5
MTMSYTPRLREVYNSTVRGALMEEFGIKNPMAAPGLHKIVVNIGAGEAGRDPKLLEEAQDELTQITGQRPTIRNARKSIANFKLREGMPIGVAVTLRGERMWDFMDRLVNLALPRVRDFRGVSKRAFDGRGNYTLGVKDQLIFPEINYAKVQRAIGMNITIVTSAPNDVQAMSLLRLLGMPFAN